MNEKERKWYVVDIHARSFYGGKAFPNHEEAVIWARSIPRSLRPFGVFILNGGFAASNNGGSGSDYVGEIIFRPIQDM